MLSHHLYGNKELKNNVLQKSFHLESFVVFYSDINTRLYNFHTIHLCIFWHLCKKDIFTEGVLRFNLRYPVLLVNGRCKMIHRI